MENENFTQILKMEQLDGPADTYFVCPANYIFTICSNARPGELYLECYDELCLAKAIIEEGQPLILRTGHNHRPDMELLEDLRLIIVLWTRSRTEITPLAQIFKEEELRHRNATSRLPSGFKTVKTMMLRYRNEKPPVPSSLNEAATILSEPHNRKYTLELGPHQRNYLRECRGGCLYFVSPTILEIAIQEKNLHLIIDAPFKIVPKAGVRYYLFIIHWMRNRNAYPVVACLIPCRRIQTYVGVLEYTKQLLGTAIISCILCDYEVLLRKAVKEVFDGIPLMGCWFYYARNVLFAARQMKARRRYIIDMDAIRMAMSVPLLPADRISEGLDFVCQRIGRSQFTAYMHRQYAKTGISVYGLDCTTNNDIESLHKQMLEIFARVHPTFWDFIKLLQEFEQSSDFLINQTTPLESRKEGDIFYEKLNRIIGRAQRKFEKDDNLEEFFTKTSKSIIGMEKIFENKMPIDQFRGAGEMVPNSIQGLKQLRRARKMAETSGNVQDQPDTNGNGAPRMSTRQRARQLQNSPADLWNRKGGNMSSWYQEAGKKVYTKYPVKRKKVVKHITADNPCEDGNFRCVSQNGENNLLPLKRDRFGRFLRLVKRANSCKPINLDTVDPSNSTLNTGEINENLGLNTDNIEEALELKIEDIKMIQQHYDGLQPIVEQEKVKDESEDIDFICESPQNDENIIKNPTSAQIVDSPSRKLVKFDTSDPSYSTKKTEEINEDFELKIEDIKMIQQHYDGLQPIVEQEKVKDESEDIDFICESLQNDENKIKKPSSAQIVDSPSRKLVKLDTSDPSNSTIKTEEINEDFELKIEDIKMIQQHYDGLQPIVKQEKVKVESEDSCFRYISLQNSENSLARISDSPSDSKFVTLDDESIMNFEEINEALELKIEDTKMIHQYYDESQHIVEQKTCTVEYQDNYFSSSSIQNEETDIEGIEIDIQDNER